LPASLRLRIFGYLIAEHTHQDENTRTTAPDILAAMVKASKRLLYVGLVLVVLLALTIGYLFSYEEVRVGGTSPLEDADTARQATAYLDAGWEVARSQYTPQLAYWLHRARWVGLVERLREVF
jgi:hypothetical protein